MCVSGGERAGSAGSIESPDSVFEQVNHALARQTMSDHALYEDHRGLTGLFRQNMSDHALYEYYKWTHGVIAG